MGRSDHSLRHDRLKRRHQSPFAYRMKEDTIVARRRTKRTYELGKRCSCRTPDSCMHDWWIRVFARGKRQRINLTERYSLTLPMTRADVEVHAAKAKDEARK